MTCLYAPIGHTQVLFLTITVQSAQSMCKVYMYICNSLPFRNFPLLKCLHNHDKLDCGNLKQ